MGGGRGGGGGRRRPTDIDGEASRRLSSAAYSAPIPPTTPAPTTAARVNFVVGDLQQHIMRLPSVVDAEEDKVPHVRDRDPGLRQQVLGEHERRLGVEAGQHALPVEVGEDGEVALQGEREAVLVDARGEPHHDVVLDERQGDVVARGAEQHHAIGGRQAAERGEDLPGAARRRVGRFLYVQQLQRGLPVHAAGRGVATVPARRGRAAGRDGRGRRGRKGRILRALLHILHGSESTADDCTRPRPPLPHLRTPHLKSKTYFTSPSLSESPRSPSC